jgi:16S rRNA (uracil1498-N3)-methyltransferase
MQGILISAMLQSQRIWMPALHQPISFNQLLKITDTNTLKFIAHCEEQEEKNQLVTQSFAHHNSCLILIGPEGDFTTPEIAAAISAGFTAVALGNTRLRTETAGIVAATLLCVQ